MTNPLISIITVNLNSGLLLSCTLKSILNQTNRSIFEIVLIDGLSNDKSRETIIEFKNQIDYLLIERDRNLYDAMNKGIYASRGKWLLFLNAGDTLFSNDTLKSISFDTHLSCAVLSGKVKYKNSILLPLPLSSLKQGLMPFCHQAMFFNKEILNEILIYNSERKLFGEHELLLEIIKKNFPICHLDIVVSEYLGGGLSEKNDFKSRKDKYQIIFNYFGFWSVISALLHAIKNRIFNYFNLQHLILHHPIEIISKS